MTWQLSFEKKSNKDVVLWSSMVAACVKNALYIEAIELLREMPVKPYKRIWGTLLSGCRSTGLSIEIAEYVVERLTTLDPDNSSYVKFC